MSRRRLWPSVRPRPARGSYLYPVLGLLAFMVSLDISVDEFIELLTLTAPAVRSRYQLPGACDPQVSAIRTDPAETRLRVQIACSGTPASIDSRHGGSTPKAIAGHPTALIP